MKKIINIWPFLIFLVIFKNWFLHPFVISTDWPFFFPETIRDFPIYPPAWAPTNGIGLGGEVVLYSLDSYIYFLFGLFVNTFGMPWEFVYKVFIFGFFILLSVISSTILIKTIFQKAGVVEILLASLIFTTNTYILMVVGGGQVGVALAYSLAPLVLASFISLSNNNCFRSSIIAGIVLSIQVMFDARISYITLIAAGIYYLFFARPFVFKKNILYALIIPVGTVIALHASWILPFLLSKSSIAQEIINNQTSLESFKFLSFANFSQTISLLHPNWPENIFGKVYFMKAEFLFIPILAFLSLLFLQGKQKITIIYFVLLGLLGAFLAKGSNEPFGVINQLFYYYIPGMSMFRDATKFYLLTALAYMVLIPLSVFFIKNWIKLMLKSSMRSYYAYGFPAIIVLYLLFLIRPVFFEQLHGTFESQVVPQEYVNLKNFLANDKTFYRTLWVPQPQRYNFYSYTHPVVFGHALFKATNSAELLERLSRPEIIESLSSLSIKYIIIPYDSFGEIFVRERKYDDKQYIDLIGVLDKIRWIKKIDGFGRIVMYEVPGSSDHFRISNGNFKYKMIKPYEYEVEIKDIDKINQLIFVESYNPYWVAKIDNHVVLSKKTNDGLNSFLIDRPGKYKIYFEKQKLYSYGRVVSGLFCGLIFFIFLYLYRYHLIHRFLSGQKKDGNK